MTTDLATNPQGGDESVSAMGVADAIEAGEHSDFAPETDEGEEPDGSTEVEIEHEGETYRIPKALKGALMRQADYTRKTQEISEHRRSLAERAHAFQQQERTHQEHIAGVARVVALNDQLEELTSVDWAQLQARDPAHAQELWNAAAHIGEARNQALAQLQDGMQRKILETQRHRAKHIQDAHGVLSREIKNWSPDLAGRLHAHGQSYGFTPAELGQVVDPRLIKLLHAAHEGALAKQKLAAAEKAAAIEYAKPLPTVAGNGAAGRGISDDQSVNEWMRRRNEHIRKKGI